MQLVCVSVMIFYLFFLFLPIVNPSPSACRGFPGRLAGKESTCNAEDPGLIPGSGRSPGEGLLGNIPYIITQEVCNGSWE